MTLYVFAPQTADEFVDWGDPGIWNGGVVPGGPGADVLIPTIYLGGSGEPYGYFIEVDATSYTEHSISVSAGNYLLIYSNLSVAGDLALGAGSEIDMYGGTLSAGALLNGGIDIQGSGLVTSPNTFDNTGQVIGGGLTLAVGGLDNTGELFAASGNLLVKVTGGAGSDTNFANGTLSGGSYGSFDGTLTLDLGGAVTVDNALIDIQATNYGTPIETGRVDSVEASGGTLDLQSTLDSIAAAGTLLLSGSIFTADQGIGIGGLLLIQGGSFDAPSATLAAGGTIAGVGLLDAGVVDDGGSIVAGSGYGGPGGDSGFASQGTLELSGAMTGTGDLVIAAAQFTYYGSEPPNPDYAVSTTIVQIDAADSLGVSFQSGAGTLILGDVQAFSGTITTAVPEFVDSYGEVAENVVQLDGIALSSVTGDSYTATGAATGYLMIDEGSVRQTLNLIGALNTDSFVLSAGPQTLSSSPPSLDITIAPLPASPSLGVSDTAGAPAAADAIVNTADPVMTGTAAAGSTVVFDADGSADGTQIVSSLGYVGLSYGSFSATLTNLPLAPGLHTITAEDVTTAGAASALQTVTLLVLPSPDDGVTTAAAESLQIASLENRGFALQLDPGTEAVQLTNGTLSVGVDTGAAYLQRLYEALLDRAGDTPGLETNAAQLQTQGQTAVATAFLGSPEFTALHPGIGSLSNAAFVGFVYQSFLGRAPDAAGLAAFTTALQGGLTRGAAVESIADSAESKGYFAEDTSNVWVPDAAGAAITELYQTALDRAPEAGGLQAGVSALMTGESLLQIAQGIVASAEYAADHAGQNDTALVSSFYEDGLGRAPDPAGLAAHFYALQSGASQAAVLLGIATSPEAGAHLLPAI